MLDASYELRATSVAFSGSKELSVRGMNLSANFDHCVISGRLRATYRDRVGVVLRRELCSAARRPGLVARPADAHLYLRRVRASHSL